MWSVCDKHETHTHGEGDNRWIDEKGRDNYSLLLISMGFIYKLFISSNTIQYTMEETVTKHSTVISRAPLSTKLEAPLSGIISTVLDRTMTGKGISRLLQLCTA